MIDPEIASLSNEQLLAVLSAFGHDVPPVYIDELYLRGSKIEDTLLQLLDDEAIWTASEEEGAYWMPVHLILALGKLTSEQAGFAIANAIRRYERDDVEVLDWVSSFWLALLENKPGSVLNSFASTMLDRSAPGYLRLVSMQVTTMTAKRLGAEELNDHFALLAGVVADSSEELPFRQQVAAQLLEFPRPQHRAALEQLADVCSEQGVMYSGTDVLAAYERGHDTPEWERLKDPWVFYSEEAVQARYVEDPEDLAELEELFGEEIESELGVPFIRDTPKIGRNDPCPCGSGKKYKKCCSDSD
jgi:SEC-C motif